MAIGRVALARAALELKDEGNDAGLLFLQQKVGFAVLPVIPPLRFVSSFVIGRFVSSPPPPSLFNS